MQYISVAWCMTAVSPVCWQWGYHGLALSYQNVRWNTMIICKVSSIFCPHHTAPVEDAPSFISFSYIHFYPCDAVLCRDDRNRYQVCWYFGGGIYNRHSICRHSVISNLFSVDIMSLSCEIAIRQITYDWSVNVVIISSVSGNLLSPIYNWAIAWASVFLLSARMQDIKFIENFKKYKHFFQGSAFIIFFDLKWSCLLRNQCVEMKIGSIKQLIRV